MRAVSEFVDQSLLSLISRSRHSRRHRGKDNSKPVVAGGSDDAGQPCAENEADPIAHALLLNRHHSFADYVGPDKLRRFSDDGFSDGDDDDTAKPDGPKAPHDRAAAQHAAPPTAMSASVAGDRSQAGGDDTDTAATLIADDTLKSDDSTLPSDGAAAQDAALPSSAMSASVADDRSQADRDDTPASERSCKHGLSTDSNNASNGFKWFTHEDRDSMTKAGAGGRGVSCTAANKRRTAIAVDVLFMLVLIASGIALVFWNEEYIGGGAANETAAEGRVEIAAAVGSVEADVELIHRGRMEELPPSPSSSAPAPRMGDAVLIEGTGLRWGGLAYSAVVVDVRASDATIKLRYADGGYKRFWRDEFERRVRSVDGRKAEAAPAEATPLEAEEEAHAEAEADVADADAAPHEAEEEERAQANAEVADAEAAPLEAEGRTRTEADAKVAESEAAPHEAEGGARTEADAEVAESEAAPLEAEEEARAEAEADVADAEAAPHEAEKEERAQANAEVADADAAPLEAEGGTRTEAEPDVAESEAAPLEAEEEARAEADVADVADAEAAPLEAEEEARTEADAKVAQSEAAPHEAEKEVRAQANAEVADADAVPLEAEEEARAEAEADVADAEAAPLEAEEEARAETDAEVADAEAAPLEAEEEARAEADAEVANAEAAPLEAEEEGRAN